MAELGSDINFCPNCGGDLRHLSWDDKLLHGRYCPEGMSRFPICVHCGEPYLHGGYERHMDLRCRAIIFQNESHDEFGLPYNSVHAGVQQQIQDMDLSRGWRAFWQRLRSRLHHDAV